MAIASTDFVTVKLLVSALPAADRDDPVVVAKAIYVVGPYSTGMEKEAFPYNMGIYADHNRKELLKRNAAYGSRVPGVWATVVGGMWLTEGELEFLMKTGAYQALVNEVRRAKIVVRDETASHDFTAEELIAMM